MFPPQENFHCVSATNRSRLIYVPVPVPVPVYVYPEHYPDQPPNFYHQSIGINKHGCFMPSFQPPYYDVPLMVNTEWTPAQDWATNKTQDSNPGDREMSINEMLERGISSPPEPVAETDTVSSPESMSLPEVLAETEQTSTGNQDPNNGGQEIHADPLLERKVTYPPTPVSLPETMSLPKIVSPLEPVTLPWHMPPFKTMSPPWATFPFEHVTPPWTTFPFEHMSLPWAVPSFEHVSPPKPVPPPMPFINTEQKLDVQLFIGGLDFSIDKQQLYKEFLPFGDLISAKVIMKNGRSKGYGFVVYSNHVDAETAIREMNGKVVGKRQLFVSLSKGKDEGRTEQKMMRQPQGQC
ncbi:Polyadenylate-binding protein 4 [Bagarius yarrelli]|uniref:Polyadenylate-binding protein 4 n=1 Tax=Bagarius yarrelli TaxID=175774 RepID=A0A556TL16_BAGYA|nr:Polyadenylate-binding protein 4 [Bagarius yarrelli]